MKVQLKPQEELPDTALYSNLGGMIVETRSAPQRQDPNILICDTLNGEVVIDTDSIAYCDMGWYISTTSYHLRSKPLSTDELPNNYELASVYFKLIPRDLSNIVTDIVESEPTKMKVLLKNQGMLPPSKEYEGMGSTVVKVYIQYDGKLLTDRDSGALNITPQMIDSCESGWCVVEAGGYPSLYRTKGLDHTNYTTVEVYFDLKEATSIKPEVDEFAEATSELEDGAETAEDTFFDEVVEPNLESLIIPIGDNSDYMQRILCAEETTTKEYLKIMLDTSEYSFVDKQDLSTVEYKNAISRLDARTTLDNHIKDNNLHIWEFRGTHYSYGEGVDIGHIPWFHEKWNDWEKVSFESAYGGRRLDKAPNTIKPLTPKELTTALIEVGQNVMLEGRAGIGKSVFIRSIAEHLKTRLYKMTLTSQTTVKEFIGYHNPITNEYVTTPAVEAYTKGGILFLDEFDAGDTNSLIALNSIADSQFSNNITGEMYEKHPDFRLIVTVNSRDKLHLYTAKRRLDKSVSDRYITVEMSGLEERFEPREIQLIELIDKYAVSIGEVDEYTSLRSVDTFVAVIPILGVIEATKLLTKDLNMPDAKIQKIHNLYKGL